MLRAVLLFVYKSAAEHYPCAHVSRNTVQCYTKRTSCVMNVKFASPVTKAPLIAYLDAERCAVQSIMPTNLFGQDELDVLIAWTLPGEDRRFDEKLSEHYNVVFTV